jgi:hypothetical protein
MKDGYVVIPMEKLLHRMATDEFGPPYDEGAHLGLYRGSPKKGTAYPLPLANKFRVSEAVRRMIVDQACALHVGVTDRWADETEATPSQILAHRP